jgi:phage terminase small subunit
LALSERERRFVEAYMGQAAGNGTEAARLAGYKGSPQVLGVQSTRLLKKASVLLAIAERVQDDPTVATRLDRQLFWTTTMQDAQVPWKDRLKASELLGKSQADFVEKHEHSGNLTVEHRGAAERLAGSLVSIAARTAKRLASGTE